MNDELAVIPVEEIKEPLILPSLAPVANLPVLHVEPIVVKEDIKEEEKPESVLIADIAQGDVALSGQTTDKIGQIVSQRKGKARKYYKGLHSRH